MSGHKILGDASWFIRDRFGLFIHWGLYSMPARHEWVQCYEKIPEEKYRVYFELFNPDLFEPEAWARLARRAGMKYVVVTSKHHEGFCLWDSAYTDFKATNTPAGRDLLRGIVDAFRAEGLRIGMYYSLPDWHHPDFVLPCTHHAGPFRGHTQEQLDEINRTRNWKNYMRYARDQVRELLTRYGKIDVLWFDGGVSPVPESGWEDEEMIRVIRECQPDIIQNSRCLHGDNYKAGFVTPEQWTPNEPLLDENGAPRVWEGCQTFSGSWGYHASEASWKSSKQCLSMLIRHVSAGGNLLMNVGPTSRGCIDHRAVERLNAFAEWMGCHSRAIYGCGAPPRDYPAPSGCFYTYNTERNVLNCHFMEWYPCRFVLPNLCGRVRYAQLLTNGAEIRHWDGPDEPKSGQALDAVRRRAVVLDLPQSIPPTEIPVVELFLK